MGGKGAAAHVSLGTDSKGKGRSNAGRDSIRAEILMDFCAQVV